MTKQRLTVSVDTEKYEYLQQDHVNASGLVNELVGKHMNGGVDEDIIREFRKKQLRGEIESAEKTLETKQRQLDRMKEQEQEEQEQYEEQLEDIAELVPKPQNRSADHPAIKTQATKLGVEPETLMNDLAERDL